MGLDISADQAAILAKIESYPTAVYETIPDDSALQLLPNGQIKPFLVVTFGPFTAFATDLTWMPENYQPQSTFVIVTAFAADKGTARSVMNFTTAQLVGYSPSANCTALIAGTGRGYTVDAQNSPTRYAVEQVFRFSVNMASQTA